jgi:hypothetical protein
MDIQDNFGQWFEAYRDVATLSAFRALAADLKLLITEQRVRYWYAAHCVAADLADGEPRRYGKPRLRLSMTALTQHMQARKDRAAAQQQLSVLVPLARRVTVAVQQWREGERAPAAVLEAAIWLLPLTLHLMAGRNALRSVPKHLTPFGYGGKVERALAERLVQAHPNVFYKPAPDAQAAAADSASAARTVADMSMKARLYQKIVDAMALTADEKRVLDAALNTAPA